MQNKVEDTVMETPKTRCCEEVRRLQERNNYVEERWYASNREIARLTAELAKAKLCRKHDYDYGGRYELGCPYCEEEYESLTAKAAGLREALTGARELVELWGAYAPEYFQDKHDLKGDLERIDAALADAEKE